MNEDYERRRTSFDRVAARYDRARPGYPTAVADDLIKLANMPPTGAILEIGCGTGKASILFAGHGFQMICLEPGENMAAIAARNLQAFPGVSVKTTTFEAWQTSSRFDLIFCAQAYHWLQADVACKKVVTLLKKGGLIGLFWNYAPEFDAEIDALYARIVPEIYKPAPDDFLQSRIDHTLDKLTKCDRFVVVDIRLYPHRITYDAAAYIDFIGTHSDHSTLPREKQQHLFRAIADVIARRPEGVLKIEYVTAVYIVQPVR